jgi:DNA repair exonuclease SbcCD ATPase subunit
MIFGYLILLISVLISVIAAWYSVAGLTAIFSAAVVPVIIMGGALEAGKIVSTVWLHNNWKRAGVAFKLYLIPAIIFLMLLTSMGIFGFLSKAHSDQSLVTGDAGSKVAIYDEKIKTAKDNIDADRKALKQMDEAVDQVMGRSTDEKGADKAVAIRRGQQKERARLLAEIASEQKTIGSLSEERAPYAADLRKVESEVGPIKYIAALIYGDEASKNMLEAAVRWVIILIVIVFDPLALTLILAANKQLEWARQGKGAWIHDEEKPKEEEKPVEEPKEPEPVAEEPKEHEPPVDLGNCPKCNTAIVDAPEIGPMCPNNACDVFNNVEAERDRIEEEEAERKLQEFFIRAQLHARALDAEEAERMAEEANAALADIEPEDQDLEIIVEQAHEIKAIEKERDDLIEALIDVAAERDTVQQQLDTLAVELEHMKGHLPNVETHRNEIQAQLDEAVAEKTRLAQELEETITTLYASEGFLTVAEEEKEILRVRVAELETQRDEMSMWVTQLENDLREAIRVAQEATQAVVEVPEVEAPPLVADDDIAGIETIARFGTEFPKDQRKGDVFMRVDYTPNRLFKWNGSKWIEIDKDKTDRYAYDQAYIQLLVAKLQRGEYDFDDLNDAEKAQINDYLKQTNVQ